LINDFVSILPSAIIPFAIIFFTFFDLKSNTYFTQHPDFHWYAKFCQGIWESGNENNFGESNILFPESHNGVTPYHYFELWLTILFGNIFSISFVKSLLLIVCPLIQTACILGVLELFALYKLNKNISISIILAATLLFVTPIYFNFYENFELMKYTEGLKITSPFGIGRKYSIIVAFGLLSVVLFLKDYKASALIVLISLPVVYIGTLPGICIGTFLFFMILGIYKRSFYYLKIGFLSTIPSLIVLLFYWFLTLNITQSHLKSESVFTEVINGKLTFYDLKLRFFTAFFPIVRLFIMSIPYFLILASFIFFLKQKFSLKEKTILLVVTSTIVSGAAAAGLALNLPHSNQFFYNVIPLYNVLIVLLIISKILIQNTKWKYVLLFPIAFFMIYSTISHLKFQNNNFTSIDYNFKINFKRIITKILENETHPRIGYLLENDSNFDHTIEQHLSPVAFTRFADSRPIAVCLNRCLDLNKYENSMWPFWFYCKNNSTLDYPSLVNRFIKKFNFQFLCLPTSKLPLIKFPYRTLTRDQGYVFIKVHYKKNS
jgi:hypothetical protein